MTHTILQLAHHRPPLVVSTHTTLAGALEAIQPLYKQGWMRRYVIERPDGSRLGRGECERLYRSIKNQKEERK